ncbi:MAG TPA: NAD-dependent deacylase [Candidatus Sulfotelmatobacter sp.]|jgi:NAD-dependent deacetylase|nr:NAD-dependent deacylase [Candidatus Sulfotelmatobacter sp.]
MTSGPIVILTGAGISKESGLDTFRCEGGVWSRYSLEDVCTPQGYRRNPDLLHDFYNARRAQLTAGEVLPNAAHDALARLERGWPDGVLIVTQNIDDLHERAGSQNIIHMHGELLKGRCEACGRVLDWPGEMSVDSICPACETVGRVRPHVVWFGEVPLEMDRIFAALERCALFLSIGTSGNVYPAAGFVAHVRERTDALALELNLEPSKGATLFHDTLYGPATQVVPDFVDHLLKGEL